MSWFYVLGGVVMGAMWLLALAMLGTNFYVWWRELRASPDEKFPSGFPFVAGLVCAFVVFGSLRVATFFKIDVPWPLLWIVLPLLLDMLGLGGVLLARVGIKAKRTSQTQ